MTRNFKNKIIKLYRLALIGIFILIPIMLILLPADFFDTGQSISVFELLGVENYYSKGMTRAVMHLIHFDFNIAWNYNKIAFIVFPLLSLIYLHFFLKHVYKVNRKYFPNNLFLIKLNKKISSYLKFTGKLRFKSKNNNT